MSETENNRDWNRRYDPPQYRVELQTPPPKPYFIKALNYRNQGNGHQLHAHVHPPNASFRVNRNGYHHDSGNASSGQAITSIQSNGKYGMTISNGFNTAQSTITMQ